MARLASEAKMGFYATSTKTIKQIIDTAIEIKEGTFALDACCGEGEAIEMFKHEYGCYNYAVELNEDRAIKATERDINKLLNADSLGGVRKSLNWAGFNFLNPPYDYAADGERLEHKFIEHWGNVTIEGGVLMLVINPSSANEAFARKIINLGYKPYFSVYDPDNDDYKNFGQYFIVLRRIKVNFRYDLEEFMHIFLNPMPIEELSLVEKVKPLRGCPPQMFKEIDMPAWKMNRLLEQSTLRKHFFDDLRKGTLVGNSIEIPNEGQAAILIAAGKLNKQIRLVNGDEVVLKGTVKKIKQDKSQTNDDGEVTAVKRTDAYQTVVYGLNLTKGAFIKYD